MSELKLHIELGFDYLAQFIKTRVEYKADFILGLVTGLFFHGITIVFIEVLFAEKVLSLNGWSKAQIYFIYGFSIFPLNLFMAFFSNLYNVGSTYIIEGNLDRILLRPLNSLFQVLLERVNIEALFGMVIGAGICYFAASQLQLQWTFWKILALIGLSFCGTLIYAGVFTGLSALSFWWPDRMGLLPPVYNMITFGKYPVTIYNPILQFILKWLIPFAFVAFFPSTWFLEVEGFTLYFWLTPVVAISTALIGYGVWILGVRRYESTGS